MDAGFFKHVFFPLLFYKRLSDVWDADYAEAFAETADKDYAEQMANERFVIPPKAHWNDVREKAKDVDADLVDCVLGLGANLFYNSPMEACVVICHNNKPAKRRGHVIFIDAVNEVTRERSMSYLKPEHQERVADAYHAFKDVEGFAKVASLAAVSYTHLRAHETVLDLVCSLLLEKNKN